MGMTDRWSKLAPLTGVLFAVIALVAVFTSGETPKADTSAAKVIVYYRAHRSSIETSDILFALAFLVVVFFAGSLRSYMRRTPAAEGPAAVVLVGAAMMSVGAAVGSGVEYGLAHNLTALRPTTVQAVNVISNEVFLPVLAGAFVFGIASGVAILRGAALPKWLGWAAIVIGIAAIIPPASFPALLGFVIWSIVVSILMYQRTGAPADMSAGAPQPVV
jgi:hypothetical protein